MLVNILSMSVMGFQKKCLNSIDIGGELYPGFFWFLLFFNFTAPLNYYGIITIGFKANLMQNHCLKLAWLGISDFWQ